MAYEGLEQAIQQLEQTNATLVQTVQDKWSSANSAATRAETAATSAENSAAAVETGVAESAANAAAALASADSAELSKNSASSSEDASLSYAVSASSSASSAAASAASALTAADAAQLSAGIYPDTASGLAATSSGQYFSVLSADNNEFVILYLHSGSSAVAQRTYPAVGYIAALESDVNTVSVTIDLQQQFEKTEVFTDTSGGIIEVDEDERILLEIGASGRTYHQPVTFAGGASADKLILGGQESSFLDSDEFAISGIFEAVVDDDERVLAQVGIAGIELFERMTTANLGGQQVILCSVEEFELSGVDYAIVDEDWRIIAGSSKAVLSNVLLSSGGTMTGPLILADNAVAGMEATPLSQVTSIAVQAAADAVSAVNSRPIQRKGQIRFAMLGDSRSANAFLFNGQASQPRSYPYWAQLFSRGAARFIGAWNFAVAGETSAQTLLRVPSAIATDADAVCILTEVNDAYGADTIGNIQAMIDAITAAGKFVVVIAELPRGANPAAWTSGRLAQHWKTRQLLLEMAQQDNVRIVDAMPLVLDPASSIGEWKAGYSYDGVHATCEGALHIGQSFADAVDDLCVTQTPTFLTNMDVYVSVDNPYGNHLANGMMTGTGGTKSGSGSPTGQVADSWTLYSSLYFTTTASKVTVEGTEWQQIQFSGTPANTGQYVLLSQQPTPSDFSIGDTVEIVCEIDVDAGSVSMFGPEFYLAVNETDEVSLQPETAVGWMDPIGATSPNASSAYAGVYHSQPYTFTAIPTSVRVGIRVRGQNGTFSSGTFRVSRVSLRKV